MAGALRGSIVSAAGYARLRRLTAMLVTVDPNSAQLYAGKGSPDQTEDCKS